MALAVVNIFSKLLTPMSKCTYCTIPAYSNTRLYDLLVYATVIVLQVATCLTTVATSATVASVQLMLLDVLKCKIS